MESLVVQTQLVGQWFNSGWKAARRIIKLNHPSFVDLAALFSL